MATPQPARTGLGEGCVCMRGGQPSLPNTKQNEVRNNSTQGNNTTSQCGSRFRGVWGDLNVGSLTSTDISACREASNHPIWDEEKLW